MTLIMDGKKVDMDADLLRMGLYCNGVFTSFVVNDGRVKGWQKHQERLQRDSLAMWELAPDLDRVLHSLRAYLSASRDKEETVVRITLFPKNFSMINPQLVRELHVMVSGRKPSITQGETLRLCQIKAVRPMHQHKTTNLMVGWQAKAAARRQGFGDALFVHDDQVLEGTGWNIFFINDQTLTTPPLESALLPGITRALILECARESGIRVLEKPVQANTLNLYQAAFITNAVSGVYPVTCVNRTIYQTKHPMIEQLAQMYQKIEESTI